MSILTYALWLVGFLTAFVVGINFLPDASSHPVPPEIDTSIQLLWGYLNSFNEILPLDTLFTILFYSIVLKFITDILFPSIFWVWSMLVKSNP